MTAPFDDSNEMHGRNHFRFGRDPLTLDDDTAERILSGKVAPEDAPPEHAEAVRLLQSSAANINATSTHNEYDSVSRLVEAVQSSPANPRGKRQMFTNLLGAKVAAVAGVALLSVGGATAAAAATNNLPSGAQNIVATTASHVGIDLPHADDSTHPGAATCHEAQQVEDAHGCSAVAKAHAPGQNKDETSTTSTSTPASTTSTTEAEDSHSTGKPAVPTKTGQEHQSTTGAEHSQGDDNSQKSKHGSTTTTSTVSSTTTPDKGHGSSKGGDDSED